MFCFEKAVNNSTARIAGSLDFIGSFALFTGCSRGRFGEQAVDIKSWSNREAVLCCFQFIERTKTGGGKVKIDAECFTDNPRRLGKGRVRLVGQAPLKPNRKGRQRRQNSPVPLAAFAHRQMRKRDLAARSDEKPLRVESSSSGRFRAWANRSYPEGKRLLLRISTGGRLWRSLKETAKRKTPKGGQKERPNREGHGDSAGSVKTFQGRRR